MKNTKEYESKSKKAKALIDEAHNRLTVGNISLKDTLEIYNLLFIAITEIENASKCAPNLSYYIYQNKNRLLKLLIPQLAAFLFLGPIGFLILPYILKKLSALSENIIEDHNQNYEECIKLADYCLLKDELLGLKALNLLNQNIDEESKMELLKTIQKVIEKIYFYITDDKLEINSSDEAVMMILILRNTLNSNNNDLIELLEELKIKMQDNPTLTRKLPHTI